jgi:hypothetical protein
VDWRGLEAEATEGTVSTGSKAVFFVKELDDKIKLVSNLLIAASPVDMNTGAEIVLRDAHPNKEGTETSKYKPELPSLLHKT